MVRTKIHKPTSCELWRPLQNLLKITSTPAEISDVQENIEYVPEFLVHLLRENIEYVPESLVHLLRENIEYVPESLVHLLRENIEYVPESLVHLLRVLLSAKYIDLKLSSATRPRTLMPPLQLRLGVQLHHNFASKFLIQSLSRLGFCCSYAEVQKYERVATKL